MLGSAFLFAILLGRSAFLCPQRDVRSFHRFGDNLYNANIICSLCVIGRWRGFRSELAAFSWSTKTIWNEALGPTRSNLFYPALGMPLASAMFGVFLSSYTAMAAVRTLVTVAHVCICPMVYMGNTCSRCNRRIICRTESVSGRDEIVQAC